MFCRKCGKELEDGWSVCPECGTKISVDVEKKDQEHLNNSQENDKEQIVKRNKTILIVMLILLIAIFGFVVAYPKIKEYCQDMKNREIAGQVVDAISTLEDEEITLESEDKLFDIMSMYVELTDEQKKYVSNYNDLEKAFEILQEKEDEKAAQDVIDEIDKIDVSQLTYDDTSVEALKEKFESLTEEQQALVTNSAKIEEYEQVIQKKKEEKAAADEAAKIEAGKQEAINTAYNAVAGKSFHLKDAQRMIEFTTSGEFIYSVSSFAKKSCAYSFSATYGQNKDEWQYLVSVNIGGVEYYFRCFEDGQINLSGSGEFNGWYEPL